MTALDHLKTFGRVKVDITFTRRIWPSWVAAQVLTPRRIRVKSGTPLNRRLLAHELVHVIQWERYGWSFPIRYLWEMRHGYHKNRFEVEAYYLEMKPEFRKWAEDILVVRNYQ